MNTTDNIRCVTGIEWTWLSKAAQESLCETSFTISKDSDRMGYRLTGKSLMQSSMDELPSSAVSFGTLQLLPDGQLIVLMAEHQTTGGYPRIAHVISADLSRLAQKAIGTSLRFSFVRHEEAERFFIQQSIFMQQLISSISFRLKDVISEHYE